MMRASKVFLLCSLPLFICLTIGDLEAATVSVVVGADTSSVLNTDGVHVEDAGEYEIEFDMTPMSDGVFTTIMTEDFRESHLDSEGEPIAFTWWMLTGGWHQFATNVDAVAATRVYLENWREQSERWGDEIALHYHHFQWTGDDWGMAPTFLETLWDFEWSISQLVLDCDVMPVSFRSGWNYMDNSYQQELERWIPFRLEGGTWMSQDVPYHPSVTNYKVPGDMLGWEVRHRYLASLTQAHVDQIFDWAAAGQDQVTCLWSHQYESGYLSPQISNAQAFLETADLSHPTVNFQYVTAHEALRLFQGSDDVTPPPLWIAKRGDRLSIVTEPGIYQIAQPWVAARTASDEYVRLAATPITPISWEIDPLPDGIDLLGVALCDMMGNATIRELRDGTKRWSSQTEFNSASPENVDALSAVGQVTLEQNNPTSWLQQTNQDGATAPLLRSYWIGQTFTPSQSVMTQASVGVSVSSGPATLRVDLREIGSDGFPNMATAGLLASAEGTIASTGDLLVDLPCDGLVLDGRQYALVFMRVAGTFQIMLHREGTYPGGNLIRAYSMDWINIPAFDCRFQTYDQALNPDQGQAISNDSAYTHKTGRFLSMPFAIGVDTIDRVEVRAATATPGDVLEVQLRRNESNSSPDLSAEGLLGTAKVTVDGPGLIIIDTDWGVPVDPVSLLFLSPEEGLGSITLESQSREGEPGGIFEISGTVAMRTGTDLWFRIMQMGYAYDGTMTFDFDSEALTHWTGGSIEGEVNPSDSDIWVRFAAADDQAGLDTATWTSWVSGTPFVIPPGVDGRWIRVNVMLMSANGELTPTLNALEIEYESEPPVGQALVAR